MKKRSILFNGIIIAAAGFVCLSLYKYLAPSGQTALTDQILNSVGLTIILFGQYIRISARGYKAEKSVHTACLITNGPYALIRHPMYFASFLIGLGIVILLLNWWILPAYVALFAVWYWPQIRNEEQILVQKFGRAYIDYTNTTPSFLPRLRTLVGSAAKKYIPLKPAWVKREWNTILVWSVVVAVTEGYEDIRAFTLAGFTREFMLLLLIVLYFTVLVVLFREDSTD